MSLLLGLDDTFMFGAHLEDYIEDWNVSVYELSQHCGIRELRIYGLLNGYETPTDEERAQLSSSLSDMIGDRYEALLRYSIASLNDPETCSFPEAGGAPEEERPPD